MDRVKKKSKLVDKNLKIIFIEKLSAVAVRINMGGFSGYSGASLVFKKTIVPHNPLHNI